MKKIRTLNLDEMFTPIPKQGIAHELLKFPGGELHIKLNNDVDYSQISKVIITHRIKNTDDLMAVLITKNALELKGIKDCDLIMPYIPYARQDRQCFSGESFTLKVFANILNSANFTTVHVFDAHSDVAPALINNCINHDNTQFVIEVLSHFGDMPVLISPDAGANKKSNKLAIYSGLDLVKCDKIRNTKTGQLSGFEVFSENLNNRECLIVDDICDGGGTFIGLANELRSKGANKVHLCISHGIFSKGFDVFNDIIDNIYCTNSFSDIQNNRVKQFKLKL